MSKANVPLISVIVSSYNYEKYIEQTLMSLVNQTFKDFEVIIVDDGSTDNSIEIIKQYTKNHSKFYLYTHENNNNKGLIETIKLGVKHSSGKYIAFLESDDYWSHDHLEEKNKFIKKNTDTVILVNGIKTIGEDRDDGSVENQSLILQQRNGENVFKYFEDGNLIPTFSCVMVKKKVLEQTDFDSPIPEWIDFWLWRQISLKHKISFINTELTFWRRHSKSYITKITDVIPKHKKFISTQNKLLMKKYPFDFVYRTPFKFTSFIFGKVDKGYKIYFFFCGIPYFEIKDRGYGKKYYAFATRLTKNKEMNVPKS